MLGFVTSILDYTGYEARMRNVDIERLLGEGFDARAWHGSSLLRALRGVAVAEALWRPQPGRHCIWEIVLHCAYWKDRVHCRVTRSRARFPGEGADWPRLPDAPDARTWKKDLALLRSMHAQLLEAAAALPGRTVNAGGQRRPARQLAGIAFHDVYHAGQIRLLRRMHADWRKRTR
jgi:DinB superfamily